MDSIGNVPIFIAVLKELKPSRQRHVIFRELILALVIIVVFYFIGGPLLDFLTISQEAVLIAGGIILFMIAFKMIFPQPKSNHWAQDREPFLVPLAVPLVAGPAVLSAVMIYSHEDISAWVAISAIFAAWVLSTIILLSSTFLRKILGEKGIKACEKLMGLILVMIAVQMFLNGFSQTFKS
jgi:multiple antibiotic resistance protein